MAAAPAALDVAAPMNERPILLLTVETLPGEPVELGGLITVVAVHAANVVRDIRENIRNLVGGRMIHYENLIQGAVDAAMQDMQTVARSKGYDGVLGIRISHPTVVDGGVEVIIYGNGFHFRERPVTE